MTSVWMARHKGFPYYINFEENDIKTGYTLLYQINI